LQMLGQDALYEPGRTEGGMTEQEWLNEQHRSQAMLWSLRNNAFMGTKAGKRKLRLFACACCRLVWDLLDDPLSRQAVEVAERFAEGHADKEELATVHAGAQKALAAHISGSGARERCAASMAADAANPQAFSAAFNHTVYAMPLAGYTLQGKQGERVLCDLLRCVLGNPFRRPEPQHAWLTSTMTGLAHATYDNRLLPSGTLEPARLSVLADALEDAGCTDAEILTHLRAPDLHPRGCWGVDLLRR
jgi:hypothetical protein